MSGSPQKNLDYTPANVLYKKEEYAWYQSGRNFYESANYASSNSRTYQLPVVDPVASAGGSLKVSFTAHTTNTSGAYVYPTVDGAELSAIKISTSGEYDAAREGTQTYTLNALHEGTTGTQVTLVSTSQEWMPVWAILSCVTAGNSKCGMLFCTFVIRKLRPVIL